MVSVYIKKLNNAIVFLKKVRKRFRIFDEYKS